MDSCGLCCSSELLWAAAGSVSVRPQEGGGRGRRFPVGCVCGVLSVQPCSEASAPAECFHLWCGAQTFQNKHTFPPLGERYVLLLEPRLGVLPHTAPASLKQILFSFLTMIQPFKSSLHNSSFSFYFFPAMLFAWVFLWGWIFHKYPVGNNSRECEKKRDWRADKDLKCFSITWKQMKVVFLFSWREALQN